MSVKVKNAKNFQETFNQILENHVPVNISLARELSELLDISLDSAYRRLRNETDYTLNETSKIVEYFKIPFESMNTELNNVVSFTVNHLNSDTESYLSYLNNMLTNLERLASMEDVHITFAAEDIPVFYHFGFPQLMDFKIKYWLKSLMNVSEFQYKHYEKIDLPEEIINTAKKIFLTYQTIDSTEVWTNETVISTIKQIKYYYDAGFFDKTESVLEIISQLESMIHLIQKNCDMGFKFNQNDSMTSTKLQFYLSDVMIGTNCILAKSKQVSASFISYSSFNFMQTTNANFNNQNEQWLNNILAKSTLVSGVSEKQRNQFFKSIYKQIDELKQHILSEA
jgi:hypothetical protein